MYKAKMVLLLLLACGNPAVALAQGPEVHPDKQMQDLLKTVNLSPEQKVKVRQIRETSRKRMQELRAELDQRRDALNQLLDSHAEDEAVRQAFQNLQNTRMALEKTRFERMLAIRAVLSEQQKAAFHQLRQQTRASARRPGPRAHE